MLKNELEKEVIRLSALEIARDGSIQILEKEKKEITEELVRLKVINRDNSDALKTSTLYIKMLLRNMYK